MLVGLPLAFLISGLGHAIRESDTTPHPELELKLKEIDAAIEAYSVQSAPTPK